MKKYKKLAIAIYNIQFSLHPEKIEKNIRRMAEDKVFIFCLQEVVAYKNSDFIINNLLKKLGGHWKAICHVGRKKSLLGVGNCIIWNSKKIELIKSQKRLLPYSKTLAIHEKIFSYLASGITIPIQRRVIIGEFKFNGEYIRISNIHLDHNGGLKNRLKQLKYFLKILHKDKSISKDIICGDFNCFDLLKTGRENTELKIILGDEYIDASSNICWNADLFYIDTTGGSKLFKYFIRKFNIHIKRRLDYIFVRNIAVSSCKKLPLKGSDHDPIIAHLSI
ncbi:hypothetical protein KKE34_01425 [Patescibacteria group bacterium]|nr:hypothetical protein [Patescibacteria group bacterium]MBU1885250.1 hypothetical protein [Patescibacteria group bacterium]